MSSSVPDVHDLFRSARDEGDLSSAAFDALSLNPDIGAQIQAGLGIAPDDVPASEVVLLSQLLDDSSSIAEAGNEAVLRAGHNLVLDAVAATRQADAVLAMGRLLNRADPLYAFAPVAGAPRLDAGNFRARGCTPLYDQTAVLLGTVLAKARDFENAGVPARTVTLIVSDGADVGSTEQTAASVRAIVEDMLRRETHIVAALGIDDGHTDFRGVFRGMGVPDRWILTPGNSASEIRAAFSLFSQSASRASQSAAQFGQAGMGGFFSTN